MIIKRIEPQGYCFGVINALKIINEAINNYSRVYVLGNIIHNKEVNKDLVNKGAIILDKNSIIPNDGVVVLTAHGTSPIVKNNLTNFIDATCPYIKKIHELIAQTKNDIIYIGKENHPETNAVLDYKNIHLVTSFEDLNNLKVINPILLNQTTLSILFLDKMTKSIINKYPNVIIYDKICDATRKRQEAVLNAQFDVLFVVGDKSSSNANELAKLKDNSYLIESYKDITQEMLLGKEVIAVTSASSTPSYLVDEVIKYIEKA